MKGFFRFVFIAAGLLLCLWVGLHIIPYIAPFLISFGAAAVMEPAVSALQRRGVARSMGAGIMTAMVLFLVGGLISCCAIGGAHLVSSYARKTPELLSALKDAALTLQQKFFLLLRSAPEGLEQDLVTAAENISGQLSQLPTLISQKALDGMTAVAKQSSGWVLFLCTALIGIYFFSAYYQDIHCFILRQLPEDTKQKLRLIRSVIGGAVTGYLKVQCIISGVTFLILLAAFAMMNIDDMFTAALIIAIVDALPILGSGAILIPWAVITLALGNFPQAVGLMLVYGVLLIAHNLLQTKLMGSHLGLHPVTALMSLYIGWKLGGIPGMLLLPVVCVLLTSLNTAGIIHLYQ